MDWASALLQDIDAGLLKPRTHAVTLRLAEHETCTGELGSEIVSAFQAGNAVGNQALLERLWSKIECLPLEKQGCFRTLVSLLRVDEPIDGHLAEYLIGWAEEAGVSASAIETAFRSI